MPRSAGEHQYREVNVTIWPRQGRATVNVRLRRKRGTDLVWERRLGVVGVDLPEDLDLDSLSGVLRLCGERLLAIAEAADR